MMECAINEVIQKLVDYDIGKWNAENESEESSTEEVDESPPIRKLFVGNISERTTYVQLRKLFRYYGSLIDVHVSRDKYTHSKKNYGFVTFRNPKDAKKVLKLERGELRLNSRTLFVAPADSWHQPIELQDGTITWNRKGNAPTQESQSNSEDITPSEKEPAADEQDLGAVGGCPISNTDKENEDLVENGDLVVNGECKINILNDDCLLHIFSFLPKTERIRIERVCKRWQSICLDMWVTQKHMDFLFLYPHYQLNMIIFEAFMKRCGKNLQSLDLSHKLHELTAKVPRIIANNCGNLRCLNLSGLSVTATGLNSLSSVCKELRILTLERCFGMTENELKSFFKKCPNLESLSLTHNHILTGKCLHGLFRAPIKQLILDECNGLRAKNLVNPLLGMKHLSHLSFNSCISLTSSDVTIIVNAVPKLCSLSLAKFFPLFNSVALLPLSSLLDLVCLNLQLNPAVNDQVMDAITKNCKKIEVLNLTGCSIHSWETQSLTNSGVKCLANLPCLIHLSMSYLAKVTDEALQAIACKGKLQSLTCRGCPNFTDVGCMSVVTSCSELVRFDFSGCDLISKATVEAALVSVKLRANNIKLTLILGGTGATEYVNEMHPLLELDRSNLSISHLRPDYLDDVYFPTFDEEEDDEDLEYDIDDWECNSYYADGQLFDDLYDPACPSFWE